MKPRDGTSSSYLEEYKRLFCRENGGFESLKSIGIAGGLRNCRYRSLCWRIYLGLLPYQRHDWGGILADSRRSYAQLRHTMIANPRKASNSDDPLSQTESESAKSPWNRYFKDSELRITIQQDVVRTYPQVQFFHEPFVQKLMTDILFVFAKLNPEIQYKQGMHELLAPIIFVLHCDHQAHTHMSETARLPTELAKLFDPDYLEHDSYHIFCRVMEMVEPWYINTETETTPVARVPSSPAPFQSRISTELTSSENAILRKLHHIHTRLLKPHDPELCASLEYLEIYPQLYGIRWLRLLFGREFTLQDLLVVWDALFGYGGELALLDCIFASMLFYIRALIIQGDYSTALGTLMRYPPVGDVHYFIEYALYLKDPSRNTKPPLISGLNPAIMQPRRSLSHVMQSPTSSNGSFPDLQKQSKLISHMSSGIMNIQKQINSIDMNKLSNNINTKKDQLGQLVTSQISRHQSASDFTAEGRSSASRVEDLEAVIAVATSKLSAHISTLQKMQPRTEENMLTIAGIKQVRDMLRDVGLADSYGPPLVNHGNSSDSSTPDSDVAPSFNTTAHNVSHTPHDDDFSVISTQQYSHRPRTLASDSDVARAQSDASPSQGHAGPVEARVHRVSSGREVTRL